MVPKKVYRQCQEEHTVSSELARDTKLSALDTWEKLYGHHGEKKYGDESGYDAKNEIEQARACGNWGTTQPSDLFLKIYGDALAALESHPASGVISPPLMGSRGAVPLTIIAPLPDLCRHLSNCIARAEHEVFLATNFWANSDASKLVTNGLLELSRRAGERGKKVVVKMMYDRGDPKSVVDNHLLVPEDKYTGDKTAIPSSKDIPNIDLQVMNYHTPVLGTFHSKFSVIDRRIGLIQSSNIQDNDNMEMLVHVEGPIVDSLYDTALISWGKACEPPLPLINSPAATAPVPYLERQNATGAPHESDEKNLLPEHTTSEPHYDEDFEKEARRVNESLLPREEGQTKTQGVTRHLNTTIQPNTTGDAPDEDQELKMLPYIVVPPHDIFPMALVNRAPYGALSHSNTETPQNRAFISAIDNAQSTILIQTPNMNAEPLFEHLVAAARRGVQVSCYLCLGYNDAGELLPFQNGTNEMFGNRLYQALEKKEEKKNLKIYYYVGKDQTRPIHNKEKKRSCHVKLMIIDEKVAIQGSGNLDTQSFFHSQEVNILYDSPLVCKTWVESINRNQNTLKYGLSSNEDACWHDPRTGEIPEHSVGTNPGHFSWAKGITGAVQRARGAGGF